jgi:uncharacterized membrane protein
VVDLLQRAAIGSLPGPVVVAGVLLFYVLIGAVGFLAERTYPMGDEAARAVLRSEPD